MATIDKVAILWTIAIVIGGVGLALAGASISVTDSTTNVQTTTSAPIIQEIDEQESRMVEEAPVQSYTPQRVLVSIPKGAGTLDCVTNDSCYSPSSVDINVGDTVAWTNDDIAVHTVTAGNLEKNPNLVGESYPNGWDSSIFASGTIFSQTFNEVGTYDYYCIVHPWMVGTVTVN